MKIKKYKKYLAFSRAGLLESFAYKFNALGWLLGDAVALIILFFLWSAIYASSSTEVINGMDFNSMITYLIYARIVASLTFSSISFFIIGEDIYEGNIAISLTKPLNYRIRLIFSSFGNFAAQFILMFLPLFLLGSIGLYLSLGTFVITFESVILFLISVVFSFLICEAFNFLVGEMAIFTNALFGLMITKNILLSFLSGSLLPISFFPEWLKVLTDFLPFKSMVETPVSILMGKLNFKEALISLLVQAIWLIILNLLCNFTFSRIKKHVVSVGG